MELVFLIFLDKIEYVIEFGIPTPLSQHNNVVTKGCMKIF